MHGTTGAVFRNDSDAMFRQCPSLVCKLFWDSFAVGAVSRFHGVHLAAEARAVRSQNGKRIAGKTCATAAVKTGVKQYVQTTFLNCRPSCISKIWLILALANQFCSYNFRVHLLLAVFVVWHVILTLIFETKSDLGWRSQKVESDESKTRVRNTPLVWISYWEMRIMSWQVHFTNVGRFWDGAFYCVLGYW